MSIARFYETETHRTSMKALFSLTVERMLS